MKESDRLYLGFREFVAEDDLKTYDNEYFSRKRHSTKFMVSLINKFIDVILLSRYSSRDDVKELCAFFINDYSRRITNKFKGSKVFKSMLPTHEVKFMYKDPDPFYFEP